MPQIRIWKKFRKESSKMNKEKIIKAIIQQGVIPLFYHPDETISIEILKALYTCGIRVVEYTNRGKQALKNLRSLAKESYSQFPDLILGMGTVMDTKTAGKAIQNGADFMVSPGYTKELSKFSGNQNVLWIPGCMTPTELIQVQDDGLGLVKIFPAGSLGMGFLKSAREVFPDLLLMPTGGVDSENLESWFQAGASAVGMGGSLISKQIVENKDWSLLKSKTSGLIKQIAAIKSGL
jgi:2-dehydro-3-deoxyphosphogluconate aldolase / (4S)-4-hydroxy-2-oxoglutarate aldolase